MQKLPAHDLFVTVKDQCWVINYSMWISRVSKTWAYWKAGLP